MKIDKKYGKYYNSTLNTCVIDIKFNSSVSNIKIE
jgi:hypothetical protein